MQSNDWYKYVPKELYANLKYRKGLLERCGRDRKLRTQVYNACSSDILFYINTFVWTFDPRNKNGSVIPFITYGFQDESILKICENITLGRDLGIVKSRDMGASWMALTIFEWFWHFSLHPVSFLLVSRTQAYVDEKGNPKSLFNKIDFLHSRMPMWLLPKGRERGWDDPGRRLLHMENSETGSVIDGESTTGDVARGDRRTAILIDEFAAFDVTDSYNVLSSTRDATTCRIFNSTPKGSGNAFYRIIHEMEGIDKLRLHWSTHPLKNYGLYTTGEDGKVKLLDNWEGSVRLLGDNITYDYPSSYPFRLDGKIRSPWYDNEYLRCATSQEVAQELDMDFLSSDYQFFDNLSINKLIALHCIPPSRVGDLASGMIGPVFTDVPEGALHLWLDLDANDLVDRSRRFVMGVDISAGTGASNSAVSVYELSTGEKVAEYVNPRILPQEFARYCRNLGEFFNNAKIVPDRSGPTGEVFVRQLISDGYPNLYFRKKERSYHQEPTSEPGVWLNPAQKTVLLETYRDALSQGRIINLSKRAMEECLQFIRRSDSSIEHSKSVGAIDPSGARTAHGDIVIADSLACLELMNMSQDVVVTEPEIPEMSLAWRMKMRYNMEAEKGIDKLGSEWD